MPRLARQSACTLALLLAAACGSAEEHPVRTHHVLEHWLNALGGKDKLGSVQTMYAKAVIVSGGEIGTLENWQTARGEYRTAVIIGDHEFITVCDGRSGWAARDGTTQDLDTDSLAAAVTRAYLGSYSQFFPDRQPGSVEWVREDSDAFVIRILPAGGVPVTFYLDKTTGLPSRHEIVEGDHTLTFYYLEWQDYDGIKTWRRGRQTSGSDTAPELTVTAQEIDWNPKLDPTLFQKPAQ